MVQLGSDFLDLSFVWSMVLLLARFGGMMFVLPGVGTERIPKTFRFWIVAVLAFALLTAGVEAPQPNNSLEMLAMLVSEIALGFVLGLVPVFVLAGLSVSGQVIAGAIGLAQANQLDRSLGTSVSVVSQVEILVATALFLMVDGHHAVILAASGTPGETALGLFRPDMNTAQILSEQLSACFELALKVAAPVLVATLLTQFVLGLITKFIPQVNIFIISLPLTLLIGLYLIEFTMPGLAKHVLKEFTGMQETMGRLFPPLYGGG